MLEVQDEDVLERVHLLHSLCRRMYVQVVLRIRLCERRHHVVHERQHAARERKVPQCRVLDQCRRKRERVRRLEVSAGSASSQADSIYARWPTQHLLLIKDLALHTQTTCGYVHELGVRVRRRDSTTSSDHIAVLRRHRNAIHGLLFLGAHLTVLCEPERQLRKPSQSYTRTKQPLDGQTAPRNQTRPNRYTPTWAPPLPVVLGTTWTCLPPPPRAGSGTPVSGLTRRPGGSSI